MADGVSGDRGQAGRVERARRVAEVMRENLRKRKARERARAPRAETIPDEAEGAPDQGDGRDRHGAG